MSDNYVFENGQVRTESDFLAWAEWFETADRIIERTDLGDIRVSTVFLGIDHDFSMEGPPLIFETMIFGGPHNEEQWRYSTLEQARAGHAAAVALLDTQP